MAVSERTEISVGEIAAAIKNSLVGGPFGSDLGTADYVPTGVPVIRGQNLSHGKFVGGDFVFVSEEKADKLRANLARPGDLVFTQRGNAVLHGGQVAIVPDKPFGRYVVSQSQMKLTSDDTKVDPEFLYFVFTSAEYRHYLQSNAVVTGVPHINLGLLREYVLSLPPLSEQKAIAAVLGALDDKIELNRRMNATLESMAQALFQSWFVDFDPVRVKLDGRHPDGMDAETAALFPESFEESEAGVIPYGWKTERLGEHVELQRGKTYKSKLKDLPGPYLLGLGSIGRNGGFRPEKLTTYGGDCPENLLVHPGELFVSLKDVTQSADLLGSVARLPLHFGIGRLTQDTVKLKFKKNAPSRSIVYRTLLTPEYRAHCRAHATGTTNLGLAREDFLSYPVIVPSVECQRLFEAHVDSIERQSAALENQSRTLATLRDTLLPKLLSGELSLGNETVCP